MGLISTDLGRAVAAIKAGGLVAVPTETVYGLAADATNLDAVDRIYAMKGRPHGHPLIVHIAGAEDLEIWSHEPSAAARTLAATAWPGPLTLIVPASDIVSPVVTGGRATVGLRVPAHPMAHALLAAVGVGLAAPSANRFGAVSPTTAQHVLDDLGHLLDPARDVILDGGPCQIGVESTIVDTTTDPPQLLRAGGVAATEIESLLMAVLAPATGPKRASGMLESHYAPTCGVRLVDHADDATALAAGTPGARILDLTQDLGRYARDLYAELRAADDDGISILIAVLPEATGLGHAIRDRLVKAAAPRPH